jgi:hypothetical protein
MSATRPSRFIVVGLDLTFKMGCITILHGLQMFTIQDQLAWHLEDFIGYFDHSHCWILRVFFEIRSDGVNRVADEHWFYETELVVAVAEGVDVIVRHQPQPNAEHHGACHQSLPKYTLLFGKNVVSNVRVHVENQSIEGHALALRDGASDRAGAEAHFEILVKPVFLIPNSDGLVLGDVGVRVWHLRSSLAARLCLLMRGSPPRRDTRQTVC